VSGLSQSIPKPPRVRLALKILWISLAVLALAQLDLQERRSDLSTLGGRLRAYAMLAPLQLLTPSFLFVWISAVIFFLLGRGIGWVRWLFLAGMVVSAVRQVAILAGYGGGSLWLNPLLLLSLVIYLAYGAGLAMLFGQEAASWFRAVRARSPR
jgi:hypothetical protein